MAKFNVSWTENTLWDNRQNSEKLLDLISRKNTPSQMIVRNKNTTSIILLSAGYLLLRLVTTDGLPATIISRLFNRPTDFIFYFFTFLIPLPALFLLWYTKKAGYILILLSTVYIVGNNLSAIINELSSLGRGSVVNQLFLFLPCGIYGYVLYMLCGSDLRNDFNISRSHLLIMIVAGMLLVCI